jgi:hypothetical protein
MLEQSGRSFLFLVFVGLEAAVKARSVILKYGVVESIRFFRSVSSLLSFQYLVRVVLGMLCFLVYDLMDVF